MIMIDKILGWHPNNKEEVDEMREAVDAYYERLYIVAGDFAEASGLPTPHHNIKDCDIWFTSDNKHFYVEWETYDKCGEYECQSLKVPTHYLWEDDWAEELRKERIRRNIEAVRKKHEEEELKRKQKDAREYKRYLELKDKFENVDFSANSDIMDITKNVNTEKSKGGT